LLTTGLVSVTGNVIAGNVNTSAIQPTSGALTISTGTGNINLNPAGNIVLASGNTYINNLAQPVQNQDAATKLYVDNLASTGITYHEPVYAATTTTLAATTGGTITYAQPNGAANGVGATLTTTTSFNLIDTANVQTVGTRILVKDQANAVQNGIYVWSNATALTRSLDADQYGANSTEEISINDYFFTTNGNVNAGTAFIVNAPPGTITFGTSNITFAIFSQSTAYTANTAAGLSLTGTVFSAKVDNDTTAFDGTGNIIVKAGANLTTPNIGAATGTSLSATGNVQGGNLLTGGLISATGTVTGSTLIGSVVTASGNITGGNVLTGGLISATSTITSSANIAGGNLLTGGLISATSTVTGSTLIGSVVTASGNITGGNILTGGLVSATGNAVFGNISTSGSGGNISGANVISSTTLSATANVVGGNITTVGLVSATGNVTGNYILGNGAFLSGVITSVANINNGTSNVSIYAANANVAVSVDGTSNVAVFATTGEYITGVMSASGNVTGGNILTGGLISATSTITSGANITGGNLLTSGLISSTGTVTGSTLIGSVVTASGNVTGGNILTGGLISSTGTVTGSSFLGSVVSATGTITGGNITTTGLISTTGNIAGGNILSNNYYYANGQAIVFGVNYTASTTPPSGPANGWQWYNTTTDVLYEYLSDSVSQYWVDVSSPAFAAGVVANVAISGSLLVNANAVYDIGSSSQTFANVYAQNYYGNGAALTGLITTVSNINNGTSNMTVVSTGGNITTNIGGVANVGVWYNGGLSITGDLSVSGNATLSGNILGDRIQNGTTQIDIQTPNGNANITIGGTANTAVFSTTALTLATNLLPSANITYDLGSTTQRWKDLWLSNSTIYLGNAQISANATAIVLTNPAGGTTVLAGATATSSVAGNVTGGNLLTGGLISATGNVAGNYFIGNGSALTGIDATSIQSGTSNVKVVSSGGNATINIGGTSNVAVFATTGEYITGVLSASGNITGGNLSGTNIVGTLTTAAQTNITSVGTLGSLAVTANVTGGNLLTGGLISSTGTITGTSHLGSVVSVTANVTGGNLLTGGLISATGNVNVGNLINAGLTSVTGNITGGNLLTGGLISATGAIQVGGDISLVGNIVDTGALTVSTSSNGNITLSPNGTGVIVVNKDIVNGQANAVGNIGSSSVYFNRLFAQATTALYADLAENYVGDADYASGTVLDFGGTQEVTISTVDSSKRVAGVVSTNPAHLMNAGVVGKHVVTVALIGRVPVRVTGTVRKGDLMVSAGDGTARAVTIASPKVGTIIGKSLEDFDGDKGTIEIVIGKH